MRTNHLFASAALAAVLIATAPAEAQRLGGGASARQGATFAGGFGRVHSRMNGEACAGVRTPGIKRLDTAAAAGAHDSVRRAETIKGNAEAAGKGTVQSEVAAAAKADGEGKATTAAAAAHSVGPATDGHGDAQASKVSTGGELGGGAAAREGQNANSGTRTGSKPGSSQTPTAQGAATADVRESASVQGPASH